MSNCVKSIRVFLARLFRTLSKTHNRTLAPVDQEMKKDIWWWHKFITQYNGVSVLWLTQYMIADEFAASDACLTGAGAVCSREYIHYRFPQEWKGKNIAMLEFLAVIITMKL